MHGTNLVYGQKLLAFENMISSFLPTIFTEALTPSKKAVVRARKGRRVDYAGVAYFQRHSGHSLQKTSE